MMIFTFSSSCAVLNAEEILTRNGFSVKVGSTPKSLNSNCGFSLFVERNIREALQVCDDNDLTPTGTYDWSGGNE